MVAQLTTAGVALIMCLGAGTAVASSPAAPVQVLHQPATTATGGVELVLSAHVMSGSPSGGLEVHLRPLDDGSPYALGFVAACGAHKNGARYQADHNTCVLPMTAGKDGLFRLVVPGELLAPPGVDYYIAVSGGSEVFASRVAPHPIQVRGRTKEHVRLDRLARHHGNVNRVSLGSEFTVMGSSKLWLPEERRTDKFSEYFGGGEVQYTHRTLGILYAFRLGINITRSSHGTHSGGVPVAPALKAAAINAGYGEVDFEFHEWFSAAARVTFGATEQAFTAGVGALLRIGPLWSTHLEAGVDWIASVGARGWVAFRWDTIPYVPMAFIIELTDQPDEDQFSPAVRTMVELTVRPIPAFDVTLRGGYAKRQNSFAGGFVAGLALGFEF